MRKHQRDQCAADRSAHAMCRRQLRVLRRPACPPAATHSALDPARFGGPAACVRVRTRSRRMWPLVSVKGRLAQVLEGALELDPYSVALVPTHSKSAAGISLHTSPQPAAIHKNGVVITGLL